MSQKRFMVLTILFHIRYLELQMLSFILDFFLINPLKARISQLGWEQNFSNNLQHPTAFVSLFVLKQLIP